MTDAEHDMTKTLPSGRATIMAAAATIAMMLPLLLVGTLAAQLTEEFMFGAAALGVAVGSAQGLRAVASAVLGRVVDRLGATLALRLAMLASAMSAAGIALVANSWWTLIPWLLLTALAHAIGQPATNRLLVNRTRADRLGTAFGIKQSAPPVAMIFAGLSVPVLAVTVGWRWAYGFAALFALIVSWYVRHPPGADDQARRAKRLAMSRMPLNDRTTIMLIAMGFGLSFAAGEVVKTFYVDATAAAGGTPSFAGVMLACASIAAIVTRLSAGISCDHTAVDPLRICAGLILMGSVGHVLLALGQPAMMAVGVVVVLIGTWGFQSVFWVAIMRAYATSPGRVTGAMAPGVFLGGAAGPILFGLAVEHFSYPIAWCGAAGLAVASSCTFLLASHRLRQKQAN